MRNRYGFESLSDSRVFAGKDARSRQGRGYRYVISGDGTIVGFVSDADIDKLSSAISTLDSDAQKAIAAADAGEPQAKLVEYYQRNIFPLRRDWTKWVDDHTGFFDRLADKEFSEFRQRYMSVREGWIARLSQKTNAPPVESKDVDVSDDVKDALSSTGNKALLLVGALGIAYILLNRRNNA